jgi:hypothetical protein
VRYERVRRPGKGEKEGKGESVSVRGESKKRENVERTLNNAFKPI